MTHFPAVAERMAVPAAPPANGTTLLAADTTVLAVIVLTEISRPGNEDAAGRVRVTVPAKLAIRWVSVAATV